MNISDLELNPPVLEFYDVKDQLKRFIYHHVDDHLATGKSARDSVVDADGIQNRKRYIRDSLIQSIGGLPGCDSPLAPEVTGTIQCDGFRIEKVIYQSCCHGYITSNLYVPDGITTPRGAVIFLCGHYEDAKQNEEYQTVCQALVLAGLVVLAQDPIGQGERLSYYEDSIKGTTVEWGCPEHDYAGVQCWLTGDGIARYFIRDAMRSIDYLCTRPEVDPDLIGVTGNSGGGTQTSLMMICDDRIAAAAPGTFIMNHKTYMDTGIAQDAEQIWPGMVAKGFDHEDILLCMAPKPVLVLAVSYDFFPIEGTRECVSNAKRFWEIYGQENNLVLFEDRSDHRYTANMAVKAAEFFSQHLLGKKTTPEINNIRTLKPFELHCTRSGQVRSEFAGACFAFEENAEQFKSYERHKELTSDSTRKAEAFSWLWDRVFFNRRPCEYNPRIHYTGRIYEMIVESTIWWSQKGIFNHAYVFTNHCSNRGNAPLIIAVWDGGTSRIHEHLDWIREKSISGFKVMVLDVSGVGAIAPNPVNSRPYYKFEGTVCRLAHDLFWIDDSLAALRIYDVMRAVSMLNECYDINIMDISIYAQGYHGMYAILAAFLCEQIGKIEISSDIIRFKDISTNRYYNENDIMSTIIPGSLKYFDLSDIERWINERTLRNPLPY